ncbi:MAG: DNA-directed RNA polymerase subunit K [archaeon]
MFSRFEMTRLISARALQLSLGAPALVKVVNDVSMVDLAEKEFEANVLPLSVLRTYPDGRIERVAVEK